MSAEQFQEANNLIKQRRFDEARVLLRSMNHPRAAEWLKKLDEIAPPSSPKPESTVAAFECTRCLREVGPKMRVCDYRDQGSCPFTYVRQPIGGVIIGVVSLIGGLLMLLTGLCLLAGASEGPVYVAFSLFCFGPGIPAILYGLYKFVGLRTRVIDKRTGILWQKERVLGIQVGSEKVVQSEVVPLPVLPNFSVKYPPSISGLIADGNDRQQAVSAIANTLMVFAAKGLIEFVLASRQAVSIFGLGHPHLVTRIRLMNQARGELVFGKLETRIMLALQAWQDAPKNKFAPNDMSLFDLGYYLFVEKKINDPFAATLAVVRDDARIAGLGTGGVQRRAPETDEVSSDLRSQVQIVQKVRSAIQTEFPALVENIENDVKKGLQKRADERRKTEMSREDFLRMMLRLVFRQVARM